MNVGIEKIPSGINLKEGRFLFNLIKNHRLLQCMANGASAYYICNSFKTNKLNGRLTSIDPFQKSQWNDNGKKLLKSHGLDSYHHLISKKSYEALPELLKKKKTYDLIFIDGWHTFDYTLVDVFYSILLLKTGGYLVVDDALHHGVAKCLKYIDSNLAYLKRLNSARTFACYQKIADDQRPWNFHRDF